MLVIVASLILLCIMPAAAIAKSSPARQQTAVLVMDVKTIGIPADFSTTLTEQLTGTIHQIGKYNVSSSLDVSRQLELEQQKDLFGCDDIACQAELAGALGADLIVTATVTKEPHNDYYFLSLTLKDTLGTAKNRVSATINGYLHNVIQELDYHIYKLFDERPPKEAKIERPAPSHKPAAPKKTAKPATALTYKKGSIIALYAGLGESLLGIALLTLGANNYSGLQTQTNITQTEYANSYNFSRDLMISGGVVAAAGIATLTVGLMLSKKANNLAQKRLGAAVDKNGVLLTFSGEFQ